MEIAAERASAAQEEDGHCQPSSFKVPPFTPTHHLRDGFLSFTEFLLRNVEEWSKPHGPWPPPPPPIAFSGSDRFIKGRLSHRTVAISASLSSLFDDAATPLLDICNHGDVHGYTIAKAQKITHDDTLSKMHDATHGDVDRVPAASTNCNTSLHVVSSDNVQKSDEADDSVQILSSTGMVDVFACSTDNALEVNAACMCPQDGSSVSANETADTANCDVDNLLPADSQCAHGSDDVTVQILHEDDGMVQPFHNVLTPSILADGLDCSLSTTKELDGSVYVPDDASLDKNCLRSKYEEGCLPLSEDGLETVVGGGKVATKTPVDVVVGHSLPVECKISLPSSILAGDADRVAELPLPSPSKSHNDNNLTGYIGGVPELSPPFRTRSHNDNTVTGDADGFVEFSLPSPTKSYNDNNFTGDTNGVAELSFPSPAKIHNENNLKGDMGVVPELSLPSTTKSHDDNNVTGDDNNLTGDADAVTELSLPSPMNSFNNVTRDAGGFVQLSLPSPRKSENVNNLTRKAEGVAELQLPPPTKGHHVIILQNTVMEAPVVLRQDEQVEDLEEGELSERLSDDKCLETSEDDKDIGEGESHPLNATGVEQKTLESTTDDEMNQPISLFISRYRTRSSVNPSTQKMTPLDTDSNLKTKSKPGKKRKIEEQEQVLKEIIGTAMADTGKSRRAKTRACASVLNDYNGGGVVSKVSTVSKIYTSEVKDDVEKKYAELGAAQAQRDQVMGTTAVVLNEREDGASRTHGKGLTQHGRAGSEHLGALEEPKVCLPMVVEEGLSTIDAGNDQKFSQAEAPMKKIKRKLTVERKKKRQQIKHRKTNERRVRKLSLKPCIDKQKEKKACHFYDRGKCSKGASCPFSHAITPTTKSEMCKYFINNCCLKGDDCPYSHALSTFPCKFFHTRGKCMGADSCRFSHEPISEEAKQKLLAKVEEEQQVREGNKVTDSGGLGHINKKLSVLPSDLEFFPLGGKRANKTLFKVTDAAASKISRLDTPGTTSTHNNISEIPMLIAAKKAASTFTGGGTSINATNLDVNKCLLSGGSLDPTGPLADKSIEKSTTPTTQSTRRESGGLLAQVTGFSSNSTMTQERKTKVDAFLQAQLDNGHLMRKSKLGTGLENSGGCYALLNQPRALSMGQTSLFKAPNPSLSRDPNAKGMGLLHASAADCSQLIPTFKPTICADTMPNSDCSVDQGKSVLNGKSIGIDACVVGPSLLDMVSMSQRATVPKGPASTSGLLSMTINATPKRSTANVFLDRFLKG